MIEVSFLAYVPDPFAVQMSHFVVRDREGTRKQSAREISEYLHPLVTYDAASLIDDLRRLGHAPPRSVVDMGDALRLTVGRSKDDGGERLWNVWHGLSSCFDSPSDAAAFEEVTLARAHRPELHELEKLLDTAVSAVQRFWNVLLQRLTETGELARFFDVEVPLHGLFARRQFLGIRVDSQVAADLQFRISAEKYSAYREVAEILNKSPTGLNFWNVHPYLASTDVAALADIEAGGRLQDAFELASGSSRFASAFLRLIRSGQDEAIVRRALVGEERLHPVFAVLGTVSGRILVSDPYLQQLRRAYRSLIIPEKGMKFAYLDYSQFEPGVLAGISEDKGLIDAYNKGDLYTALAEAVFGGSESRPLAKRAFLAFLYGMSPERIARLLAGPSNPSNTRQQYSEGIAAFFDNYSGLSAFRTYQQNVLLTEGQVASLQGNRRIRTMTGALTPKESRWALNQPVQATASLIFKEALRLLADEFGDDSIVLPVHDAALMQFNDDTNFNRNVEKACDIMVASFQRRLPRVNARVMIGSFAE